MGSAALAALVVSESMAWTVGLFVGSTAYLLITAAEMVLARRIEETRNLTASRQP